MKALIIIGIIFLSTSAASKTLYQARVWINENNTKIRVKSEFYPNMDSCSNNLYKMSDFYKGKGYKAMSSNGGSYKNFKHYSYIAKKSNLNLMLTCTTLP